MISIDCLVKSETYKKKIISSSHENFKKNFKTALCGVVQNGSFQNHLKPKFLVFVRFDSFVFVLLMGNWEWKWENNIHIVDFNRYVRAFPQQNTWIPQFIWL